MPLALGPGGHPAWANTQLTPPPPLHRATNSRLSVENRSDSRAARKLRTVWPPCVSAHRKFRRPRPGSRGIPRCGRTLRPPVGERFIAATTYPDGRRAVERGRNRDVEPPSREATTRRRHGPRRQRSWPRRADHAHASSAPPSAFLRSTVLRQYGGPRLGLRSGTSYGSPMPRRYARTLFGSVTTEAVAPSRRPSFRRRPLPFRQRGGPRRLASLARMSRRGWISSSRHFGPEAGS